jgi:hypothetical protein
MLRLPLLLCVATALSGLRTSRCAITADRALARPSQWFVLVSMATGCIIADPPPYTEPVQTPPRLDLVNADPPIDRVIVRNSGEIVQFSVPVASEDAGDELVALFFRDYEPEIFNGVTEFINDVSVPPSTLDDEDRPPITLPWRVDVSGCHSLTLIVTHRNNLRIFEPVDPRDQAKAVWWGNFDATPGSQSTLVDCPFVASGGG